MMTGKTHVVVLGGGYAGVMAANRLAGSGRVPAVEVTLVDPGPQFTERIRLHEVAAGARESAGVEWAEVLHPRVQRVQARAVAIDDDHRMVALTGHEPVHFDRLIYAVGSSARPTSLLSVADPAAARTARDTIAGLPAGATVTIAGAGPTGVELACAVAVSRPDLAVAVVAPSGLAHPLTAHQAVARRLQRLGIAVGNGRVDPATGAATVDGSTRPVGQATVWTVGFAALPLATDSGLPVTGDGRLMVDATLTVPGHERILGAGDAVAVQGRAGRHLRASCASALPMGAHAADTVLARLSAPAPDTIDIGYLLQCLDLGAGRGHVQAVHPDDTARPWALAGRAGGWAKEQVCRMTLTWLAREARRPGSFTWPSGPAVSVD